MSYVEVPSNGFNKVFSTWIIAFCPDTAEWFVTNHRYFYFEFEREFSSEEEGVEYFVSHAQDFYEKEVELGVYRPKFLNGLVYLSNTDSYIKISEKNEVR